MFSFFIRLSLLPALSLGFACWLACLRGLHYKCLLELLFILLLMDSVLTLLSFYFIVSVTLAAIFPMVISPFFHKQEELL